MWFSDQLIQYECFKAFLHLRYLQNSGFLKSRYTFFFPPEMSVVRRRGKHAAKPEKRGCRIRQTRSYLSRPEEAATLRMIHEEERPWKGLKDFKLHNYKFYTCEWPKTCVDASEHIYDTYHSVGGEETNVHNSKLYFYTVGRVINVNLIISLIYLKVIALKCHETCNKRTHTALYTLCRKVVLVLRAFIEYKCTHLFSLDVHK